MENLKKVILPVLHTAKTWLAAFKLKMGKKLGLIQSLMIMPYQGFGNQQELFFMGRVLRDRGIGLSTLEDSKWRNFSRMYKRFMTWEIPFVAVEATFNEVTQTAVTDEEGYFRFHIKPARNMQFELPLLHVQVKLMDKVIKNQGKVEAIAQIYVASQQAAYAVISDIDDTIVPTGATRLWEMFKTTFFSNAHSRIPFPGVAAFYDALAKGITGNQMNPLFYVSSSPWNLYDFLTEFMEVHGIPHGPLMLRDIGLTREYFTGLSHTTHKLMQVERIFSIISDIPFILIGDSGQHDAEIYLQVIKDFPGRVKMVYIRDVDPHSHKRVLKIAEEIKKRGVELMLVKDTVEAARHAVYNHWIADDEVWKVKDEKAEDEALS